MYQRTARHLVAATMIAVIGTVLAPATASAIGDRDCGDFSSQRAAQIFFLNHGGPASDPHRLDSDGDGIACETNPAPTYYGSTVPGQSSPSQPTKVASRINLALSRSKAIAGEKVKLIATVQPKAKRTVVLQKRQGSRWRTVTREATNRRGKAVHAVRSPQDDVQYRAKVLKKRASGKIYLADTSDKRRLKVQSQRATLALSQTVIQAGDTVRATVTAAPVRVRRTIVLAVLQDGVWEQVRTGAQDRDGEDSFTLPSLGVGQHEVRASINRWRGAAEHHSTTVLLTVQDPTAPTVP